MMDVSGGHDETDCGEGNESNNTEECIEEHVEETCWSFLYKHLRIAGYWTPISSRKYIYSNRPNTGIIRWVSDILGMIVVGSGFIYTLNKIYHIKNSYDEEKGQYRTWKSVIFDEWDTVNQTFIKNNMKHIKKKDEKGEH